MWLSEDVIRHDCCFALIVVLNITDAVHPVGNFRVICNDWHDLVLAEDITSELNTDLAFPIKDPLHSKRSVNSHLNGVVKSERVLF